MDVRGLLWSFMVLYGPLWSFMLFYFLYIICFVFMNVPGYIATGRNGFICNTVKHIQTFVC